MTPSHVRYRAAPRPDLRRELSQNLRSPSRSEACAERTEAVTDAPERLGVRHFLHAELELLGRFPGFGDEALLGALEREALLVEQGLDALDEVEVAPAIEALPRRVLLRPQKLELRLPVAEDVRRHAGDRLNLADPVVELLWGGRRSVGYGVALLIRCFRPLLGFDVSTLRAVISIHSPVRGLRPRPDPLLRVRKCPKPTILTSSPRSKHRKMMSKTDSTTEDD